MKISKEVRIAVARVFDNREYEDKEYVGTILPDELRKAAEFIGGLKQEVSRRAKANS